jgi:hypothetical protein
MPRPEELPADAAGPPETQDLETRLLQDLQGTERHLEQVTVALLQWYAARRQPDRALPHAARLLGLAGYPAHEARAALRLGGLLEQVHAYESAATTYRRIYRWSRQIR